MKMGKTKLHHHRKSRVASRPASPLTIEAMESREVDHDLPDPDMISFQMSRSPRQENL
jgi:hypothetical protein